MMPPRRTKQQDEFEERAAILEFDAGYSRDVAEKKAKAQLDELVLRDVVFDSGDDFL